MYAQIFQEIGLTPNEAKIYETLISKGELKVSSISLNSGIHRRNAYDAIDRLVEKGLIFPVLSKGENTYKAASPSKLLEIVRDRENKLSAILPALEEQYNQSPRTQEAFIYRGLEGVKNYFKDILKTGSDLYMIGGAGFLFEPSQQSLVNGFLGEAETLGLKEKWIFYLEQKEKAEQLFRNKEDYKFFSAGKIPATSISIFGDHVVSIVTGEKEKDITLYVTIDKKLADGYRQIFETLWESLSEEKTI